MNVGLDTPTQEDAMTEQAGDGFVEYLIEQEKIENAGCCPKCGAVSGDDWSQCVGVCPMPMSPYHKPAEATE